MVSITAWSTQKTRSRAFSRLDSSRNCALEKIGCVDVLMIVLMTVFMCSCVDECVDDCVDVLTTVLPC
jgi:hypothetical protein